MYIKNNEITVIITLYKTPAKNIELLKQYKDYRLIVYDQCAETNIKKKLKKLNLEYYCSNKNIGLSKATNFLISKVKTRYFFFTQADIKINSKSLILLKNAIKERKNIIFTGPKFVKRFKLKHLNKRIKKYKIVKHLNAACMLCDVKKVKKIGFFDNDFFLYWEDIFLMNRINNSKYKMLFVSNAEAIHAGGKSTKNNYKIRFIRTSNFKYGEFLFSYKVNKKFLLKLARQTLYGLFFFMFYCLVFNRAKFLDNFASLTGIFKFLKFFITKKFSLFKL